MKGTKSLIKGQKMFKKAKNLGKNVDLERYTDFFSRILSRSISA